MSKFALVEIHILRSKRNAETWQEEQEVFLKNFAFHTRKYPHPKELRRIFDGFEMTFIKWRIRF